ncbi:MAG TPA: LysR family transcriptional regulator [Pseudohongiella sp.]|nr:transcriptional regulator [Pseudohongiella sp.]HBX38854.1 LysR family transcriptional regulator [Pseudohongiella sp.]|tara:strand:+ start:5134 stop:6042 length:909 start_codon:yes stop_codon:yes gene_type:complete
MKQPRISLEQWAAFVAVVDEGSFARAAEQLNKSQSSISYAISRINELLPTAVLTLSGRKATLTREGKVMYRRAKQLLQQAQTAEQVAATLARGTEPEVVLAVDGLLEPGQLLPTLERFSAAFPMTRLRILETQLSGTEEAILERKADVVISHQVPVGYMGTPLKVVRMIPVAHPDHPLAQQHDATGINDFELRSWRQIVLRDSGQRREQDAGWLGSEQRWTVSHFSTTIKALRAGLGFAFLPTDWVKRELASGELKQLSLSMGAERRLPLYLVMAAADSVGPATKALARLLIESLGNQSETG